MPVRRTRKRIAGRRRRAITRRVMRGVRRPITTYNFKRTFRLPTILFNASSTLVYGQEFSINNLPDVSDFSNLFDLVRINAVKMQWVATLTGSDANPSSTSIWLPNIVSVIDYTDSSPPSSLNELLQYPSMKRSKINAGHTRYLKPRIATDAVAQSGLTGYLTQTPKFHSFGAPIAYYGVKWMLDQIYNVPAGQGIGVDRYVTLYFTCKNVR